MASADVLSWEQDYPWYYKVLIQKPYGAIDFLDEYGTPFWSKIDYVLLKPEHPIFTAKKCEGALKNLHQELSNQLKATDDSDELKKQPVKVSKTSYIAAKLMFREEIS